MPKHPFHSLVRVFGTTTIAARGQVVLPIAARRRLKLKPGDTLLAVDCCGILTLMKPKEVEALLTKATAKLQHRLKDVRSTLHHA